VAGRRGLGGKLQLWKDFLVGITTLRRHLREQCNMNRNEVRKGKKMLKEKGLEEIKWSDAQRSGDGWLNKCR
jgi:hypothetical protein